MKKLKRILSCLAFLLPVIGMAQGNCLQGKILDADTKEPVAYAEIRWHGRVFSVVSDTAGNFCIPFTERTANLEVKRLGYKKLLVVVPLDSRQMVNIQLHPGEALEAVRITSGPSRVFEDKRLHLYDYEFVDNHLVVITYDRKRRHSQLGLVGENDSIIGFWDAPQAPGKLSRDCLGSVHAITEDYACQLWVEDDRIEMFVDQLDLYKRVVEPCICTVDNYHFYQRYRFFGQVLNYFGLNAETGEWFQLIELLDKVKIHQIEDPMGPNISFASNLESFEPAMVPPAKPTGADDYEAQYLLLAHFYPLPAPMKAIEDTLFIFDHHEGLIRVMKPQGEVMREVPISYQKEPGWVNAIYIDEIRGEAYVRRDKHGYAHLARLNLQDGSIGSFVEVPRQFPQKLIIRDRSLFFMYKEGIHDDVKRLYRMNLN